jgi:hypothetical protein
LINSSISCCRRRLFWSMMSMMVLLLLAERPGHALAEQLRALADGRQRRLQVVRDMAQKAVLLLFQLCQAPSQPVEPPPEIGQVLRSGHRHAVGVIGAADGADGPIELLELAGNDGTKPQGDPERHRNRRKQLPHQRAARIERRGAQMFDLDVDQMAAR